MKPIYNIKQTFTVHYDLRGMYFSHCLKCHKPLEDNAFMCHECWRESSRKEKDKALDLGTYMNANNLSDFEMDV